MSPTGVMQSFVREGDTEFVTRWTGWPATAGSPQGSRFLDVLDGSRAILSERLLDELPVNPKPGIPIATRIILALINALNRSW